MALDEEMNIFGQGEWVAADTVSHPSRCGGPGRQRLARQVVLGPADPPPVADVNWCAPSAPNESVMGGV